MIEYYLVGFSVMMGMYMLLGKEYSNYAFLYSVCAVVIVMMIDLIREQRRSR